MTNLDQQVALHVAQTVTPTESGPVSYVGLGGPQQTAWTTLNQVAASKPMTWRSWVRMTATRPVTWFARSVLAPKRAAASWFTRATLAAKTAPAAWTTRALMAASKATTWATRKTVQSGKGMAWFVRQATAPAARLSRRGR